MPDTTPTLRDRIRRAICEASGFTWLPDELLEPDEYGEHADAVLAVLPASAPAVPADRATDRRDRYAAALARVLLDSAGRLIPNHIAETAQAVSHSANAVMAVADAEQAALRAEVNRLRADRATVLRETIATVEALPVPDTSPGWALGAAWALAQIRRLADEAQPTETYPPAFPWATLMDTEDLAEFLAEIEHAVATPGATPAEALAAAEKACSTWRLIAEAQHGHNTAPGPAAAEEPQP